MNPSWKAILHNTIESLINWSCLPRWVIIFRIPQWTMDRWIHLWKYGYMSNDPQPMGKQYLRQATNHRFESDNSSKSMFKYCEYLPEENFHPPLGIIVKIVFFSGCPLNPLPVVACCRAVQSVWLHYGKLLNRVDNCFNFF